MHAALTRAASGIGANTARLPKTKVYKVTAFDIAEPNGVDHWIKIDQPDPASIR